jgi:hypothetical protein
MIRYALQPGSDRGIHSLFRGVEPYVMGSEEETPEAEYVEIFHGITMFDLQYLDGEEWKESWKSSEPPKAVKLILDFRLEGEDRDKETVPLETVFSIPSS